MAENPTLSQQLAQYVFELQYDHLDKSVLERTQALYLDWFGSALAGRGARPVMALEHFAKTMGPSCGRSLILTNRTTSSPYFAALINAAASHVVEQDDLHNSSVFHPATVVFPALLALAQSQQSGGKSFLVAAVAGYEVGIRVGKYLGQSHYKVFHTTATAGTLAAAAASAKLLGLSQRQIMHALGSAGTQAAGLWEFLRDAADSKQLHTAKASADGMLAALTAQQSMTGATHILEGNQGMAAAMFGEKNESKLTETSSQQYAVMEVSFKYHASCRHTHPAADALLELITQHKIEHSKITKINVYVYQAAIDVLGAVTQPHSIHQAKFSMGFVLALIAHKHSANVDDFNESTLSDSAIRATHGKVEMLLDDEINNAYPAQWSARVEVDTVGGERFIHTVNEPKGDPGNTLSRDELENKFRKLAKFAEGASISEIDGIISNAWRLSVIEDFNQAVSLTTSKNS